jgi:hypothetical protein
MKVPKARVPSTIHFLGAEAGEGIDWEATNSVLPFLIRNQINRVEEEGRGRGIHPNNILFLSNPLSEGREPDGPGKRSIK